MIDSITLKKLIGTWKLVKADVELEDGVEMTINSDGKIDYIIHHGAKEQRINLDFQLEKNLTISNLQERTTRLTFERGYLLFDYEDSQAWFERVV